MLNGSQRCVCSGIRSLNIALSIIRGKGLQARGAVARLLSMTAAAIETCGSRSRATPNGRQGRKPAPKNLELAQAIAVRSAAPFAFRLPVMARLATTRFNLRRHPDVDDLEQLSRFRARLAGESPT